MITAMFRDRDAAEQAYRCLTARGYQAHDVSLLMSDEPRRRSFPPNERAETELGTKAAEGAGERSPGRETEESHGDDRDGNQAQGGRSAPMGPDHARAHGRGHQARRVDRWAAFTA